MKHHRVLFVGLGLGAVLRLIPLGNPIPMDDGAIRLYKAVEWSLQPVWYGLGGQWPPLVMYLQGLLIRLGADPLWTASLMGYIISVATLYMVYLLGIVLFKESYPAAWGVVFASIYWYHISIVNMNFIENLYTLLLVSALYFAVRVFQSERPDHALLIGCALCTAGLILTRHEGRLVFLVLLAYALFKRNWQFALWFGSVNGLLLLYLLGENWVMRGDWLADLRSAYANFAFAAEATNRITKIYEKFYYIRWIFQYMPSIFCLLFIGLGVWHYRQNFASHIVMLPVFASLLLLIYSAVSTPLVPFIRYFVPIFMPLMPFAGAGWSALVSKYRWLAWMALLGMIVIQPLQWFRMQSYRFGRSDWRYALPRHELHPQQVALEKVLAGLPRHSRVYVLISPRSIWSYMPAIVNLRRPDLIPSLRYDQHYDQYLGRPTERLDLNRELLQQADYLVVHPDYPRMQELQKALPPVRVLYRSEFLEVLEVIKPHE